MSYIFRLHREGNNTINGWGNSNKYGTSIIDQIQDPNGDSAKREITSIPSPFARIDLVKTAFKKVADGNVDGNDIHHKMVSDALDVAQIFFEYEKFKDKVEIITWDKDDCIRKLIQSPYESHKQFGEVLRTYNEQDGRVYNFDKMDRMFLLNYINGPKEINIIGATSPATLFFTPANDLSFVKLGVGQDIFFDDGLMPLYKRDIEFQKFVYSLSYSIQNFSSIFKDIDKYLKNCLEKLDDDKREILKQITPNDYAANYNCIAIDDNAGNTVSILKNVKLRCKEKNSSINLIAEKSGFVIDSPKCINGVKPLVLPTETDDREIFYTQDVWNKHWNEQRRNPDICVKCYDKNPISERILPFDGSKYPYLTICDFLMDSMIEMPYKIDNERYFDGNLKIQKEGEKPSYLLPLTDTFFEFFTVDDLLNKSVSGKKMFELENITGGITVILRIPIKSGFIAYRKRYIKDIDSISYREENCGTLIIDDNRRNENENPHGVKTRIGLGIMPFVRFPQGVSKHYRIALADKCKPYDVQLVFFEQNSVVNSKKIVCEKKPNTKDSCSHEVYVVEDNFDRIKVDLNYASGYIIPCFDEIEETKEQFLFAVDFGTTNTHIEYCTSNDCNPRAFIISQKERQFVKLHDSYETEKDIKFSFDKMLIPETIGDNDRFSFPMRTVYAQNKDIDFKKAPSCLGDAHIPFLYEKDIMPNWRDIKTELKWGTGEDSDDQLKLQIEELFILMRNKVLLNKGNLSSTKIIWFYPVSMTKFKINKFERIWNDDYNKYFGPDNANNVKKISESTAPYYHFRYKKGANSDTITIDIGGGTTDVFVVENTKARMLMSFRYASNAIFGDGFNGSAETNGFVKKFKCGFEDVLLALCNDNNSNKKNDNDYNLINQAMKSIIGRDKSSDIIAFFFSLADKDKRNEKLNFRKKLEEDEKFKYVFIVFYGSMFYFISKAMKLYGLDIPKTIAFSGNGSNTLHVLSTNDKVISEFIKIIFDDVYGTNDVIISIKAESNPKIATCQGGLEFETKKSDCQDYDAVQNIRKVIVGNQFNEDVLIKYKDINDTLQKEIIKNVQSFLQKLFDNKNKKFLIDSLGVDKLIYDRVKDFCVGKYGEQILVESLRNGLNDKLETDQVDSEEELEDTLFFYPLVGLLHELAWEISNM